MLPVPSDFSLFSVAKLNLSSSRMKGFLRRTQLPPEAWSWSWLMGCLLSLQMMAVLREMWTVNYCCEFSGTLLIKYCQTRSLVKYFDAGPSECLIWSVKLSSLQLPSAGAGSSAMFLLGRCSSVWQLNKKFKYLIVQRCMGLLTGLSILPGQLPHFLWEIPSDLSLTFSNALRMSLNFRP